MNRFSALLSLLLFYGPAFAADGEVPQETVGTGGIVAFFVVCLVVVGVGIWYVRKNSQMTAEERAGDKIGEDK